MKDNTTRIAICLGATLCICAGALCFSIFGNFGGLAEVTAPVEAISGPEISTIVLDAKSGEPISGAAVVFPELEKTVTTDENGIAASVNVPFVPDSRTIVSSTKTWSETTMLVYADGYVPCALFCARAGGDATEIRMLPLSDAASKTAVCLTQSPDRLWVEALIEQFRPKS